MVPVLGWDKTEVVKAKGLHPESNESTVINIISDSKKSNIYVTLMLWKKSGEKWKNKELVPVKIQEQKNGSVTLEFDNGIKKVIDFNKN